MSWSKVKYFFDTPEEREAYEKEQEEMKKQQDPQQQDIPLAKVQPKQNIVSIETAKQSSKVVC